MEGATFQNYRGEGMMCYPVQESNGFTDRLEASSITNLCDDILAAISSNFDLISFGITNQVCTKWKSVNSKIVVIASIFSRHYSKFRSPRTCEKFTEIVMTNLDAFTFENEDFFTMIESACDWRNGIKIIDKKWGEQLALRFADHLPDVEEKIWFLPLSLIYLTSLDSKIVLTNFQKIELLKQCAQKNPRLISYNIPLFFEYMQFEEKDLIELAKICVKKDYCTLHYINCLFGLKSSILKEIRKENNIEEKDLSKIIEQAEKKCLGSSLIAHLSNISEI